MTPIGSRRGRSMKMSRTGSRTTKRTLYSGNILQHGAAFWGVIEHIPIRNRDHRSALGSLRTREANLTAWGLSEKQWPNCRVTPAVNRRAAKAQNCPTAIRSRQREGLTQSGGYNLFVLTFLEGRSRTTCDQQGACRTVRIGSASLQMPIMAREYGRNACAFCALVAARSRPRRCF